MKHTLRLIAALAAGSLIGPAIATPPSPAEKLCYRAKGDPAIQACRGLMQRSGEKAGYIFALGLAELRAGKTDAGYADLATAQQQAPKIEAEMAERGIFVDVSNPEMTAIFEKDQNDRRDIKTDADWKTVAANDKIRYARTKALIALGRLYTMADFIDAAFIFQHGETAEDYMLAHILALVALKSPLPAGIKPGDVADLKDGAIWIASATLDRYLQKTGQKQVLGTQYRTSKGSKIWTQEPYNRTLIPDALRIKLGVRSQAEQDEFLKSIQKQHDKAKT